MKKILISLFTFLLSISSCSKEDDFSSLPLWSPTDHGYELVWEDNFDSTAIDRTKWDYRSVGSTRGMAVVDTSTIYLDGEGHLVIEFSEKDGTFYVGQLTTQNKQLFKYGYFECNVMLNKQPGMYPAFWLQSPKIGGGEDPSIYGAEIDIFEYKVIDSNSIYNTVWWNYGDNIKGKQNKTLIPQINVGFHKFGLEWTPEEYVFYVDNKEIWRTTSGVSQIEQYIILSTEYKEWGGGGANPQTLPDKVFFDYVKVYSRNYFYE